jgi:hypothetical protein
MGGNGREKRRTLRFVRNTTPPELDTWNPSPPFLFKLCSPRAVLGGLVYSVFSPGSGVNPLPSSDSITQLFGRKRLRRRIMTSMYVYVNVYQGGMGTCR